MSTVGEAIRRHHRHLLKKITGEIAAVAEGQPGADPRRLAAFLKHELLPHARAEERYLYPAVDPLIKVFGTATATMSVDHEFLEAYVREIDETTQALPAAQGADRAQTEARLRKLVLQLEGILRLHLEKEERVYLPLFEQYMPGREQRRVLEAMHEVYEEKRGSCSSP